MPRHRHPGEFFGVSSPAVKLQGCPRHGAPRGYDTRAPPKKLMFFLSCGICSRGPVQQSCKGAPPWEPRGVLGLPGQHTGYVRPPPLDMGDKERKGSLPPCEGTVSGIHSFTTSALQRPFHSMSHFAVSRTSWYWVPRAQSYFGILRTS